MRGLAMIVEAGPADLPAVTALLQRNVDVAMFALGNLAAHGLADGRFASDHDHATRVWRIGDGSLVALTRSGMLMPLLTGQPDLAPLAGALRGQPISGAVGPAASVRPVLAALGLQGHPTLADRDEPGFGLDLAALKVPPAGDASLVPLSPGLRPVVVPWRAAYHVEVLGTPPADAVPRAAAEIDAYLARDSHRVLLRQGEPVSMTGFNARLPDIVQVGGVYTPPALRGRGHARHALALHLAEARAAGVRRAVLFAASAAAARAYVALGFQPTQPFALVLFSTPAEAPPCT